MLVQCSVISFVLCMSFWMVSCLFVRCVVLLCRRKATILSSRMASSASTSPWNEPARLRAKGIFSLWVCLGFTCWDADIHGGPTVNIFLGIRRYHTSTYLCKLVRNIWAMGFVHFSSSDQENPTLDSMSPLRQQRKQLPGPALCTETAKGQQMVTAKLVYVTQVKLAQLNLWSFEMI